MLHYLLRLSIKKIVEKIKLHVNYSSFCHFEKGWHRDIDSYKWDPFGNSINFNRIKYKLRDFEKWS